jgi:uncharacterized damage-inducible protein DinB
MLRELFAHAEWADAAVWRAVLATPQARGDTVIEEKCYHVHASQHAFLSLWRGAPAWPKKLEEFHGLAEIAAWARAFHEEARALVATLRDGELDRTIAVPWAPQAAAAVTLRETLIQMTSHSTHHRGQISMRLRELESVPPPVDFIVWAWLGKPAASWPDPS